MSGGGPERIGRIPGSSTVVRFAGCTLDPGARLLRRAGADVHLTPKAFDLLLLLIADTPRVVSKAELHERLWPGTFVSDASLVALVKELRRVLEDRDPAAPLIRTAHGVGYAFAAAVDRDDPPDTSPVWHWIEVNGRTIRLLNGENVIGRDPASRVWLDVASVSRRHARIVVDRASVVLEDLGSKNRTVVGSTPVSGSAPLQDGDAIAIGPLRLVYRTSASGLPTETHVEP